MRVPGAGGPGGDTVAGDNCSQEKYDSYLTKLQNICTEQVGEEAGGGAVKPVTESLKSALQNISLPTPT